MRRLAPFTVGAAIAAAAAAALPAPALAQDAATSPVKALSDGLVSIMKSGKKLGFAGRAEQIAPVVDKVFDLPLMTRLAVGVPWNAASPGERTALVAAIRKLTINQYAANFDSWSGQAFAVDANVASRGTDKLVKTQLTAPKTAPVSIAYRLRQSGLEWRVIDVFYQNSISQLATRRADFDSIVAKGGARALISHVNTLADKAAN